MEIKPHKSIREIEKFLADNEFDGCPDIEQVLFNARGREEWIYDIRVTGDWKHTHGYLKYLMEQLGYVRLFCKDIYNPDYYGSDFGECLHRYMWKTAADIFKYDYEDKEEA